LVHKRFRETRWTEKIDFCPYSYILGFKYKLITLFSLYSSPNPKTTPKISKKQLKNQSKPRRRAKTQDATKNRLKRKFTRPRKNTETSKEKIVLCEHFFLKVKTGHGSNQKP